MNKEKADIDLLLQLNAEGTSLRRHQQKMLEMLRFIDDLCRKNGIPYFLSGGTFLGAVRHKGFIPWDDDLDIALLKKDHKKLHRLLKQLPDSCGYALQANDTDANYVAPYEKLRCLHSVIKEENSNDRYYKYNGIYIDLFFLEPASKPCHRIAYYMQRLLLACARRTDCRKSHVQHILLRLCYQFIHRIAYPILVSISRLLKPGSVSYPLGSFFNTQFKKEWIFPLQEMEFEGYSFFAPRDSDAMLKAQYGNYWEYPPADKIERHITKIDFNINDSQ